MPTRVLQFSWNGENFRQLPLTDQVTLHAFGSAISSLGRTLGGDCWHVKGTAALIAYLGPTARMPRDLDVSVGVSAAAGLLRADLLASSKGERIAILRKEQVRFTNMSQKPPVHRMLLSVDRGRQRIGYVITNMLVVSDAEALNDQRIDLITFPEVAVSIPAARLTRCLAQKLLRYTLRRSGGRVNTRWSDLFDFLIAAHSPLTAGLGVRELRHEVEAEFVNMHRPVPEQIPEPPAEWLDYWDTETFRTGATFGKLTDAAEKLVKFWSPVLVASSRDKHWNPASWTWE